MDLLDFQIAQGLDDLLTTYIFEKVDQSFFSR